MTTEYIEYLCNLKYDDLKYKLLTMTKQQLEEVLQNYKLKEKLINSPKRHDFIWLAQEHNDYIIPILLDDIGINILSKTTDLIDKLNGILTSNEKYVTKLFNNSNFINLIINNLPKLDYYLYSIDHKSAQKLLEHTTDTYTQLKIIKSLRNEIEELVKTYHINNKILMNAIISLPDKATEYLLKHDLRITSLNNLSYPNLLTLFQKNITIPYQLLEEKDLLKKITTIHDPKNYRILINYLTNNNDTNFIESNRKQYYETEIKCFNKEHNMLSKYYNIYQELITLFNKNNYHFEDIEKILNKYINPFSNENEKFILINKILEYQNNPQQLKELFQKESHYLLTNMIIDYHFEDIYYNFLIDLKELSNFQQTKGKTLNDEDIKIYNNLLNLDNLSYNEKLTLFEQLKTKNPLEKYYDDFRTAKNKAYSMVKEQMLNFDNITKYKNEELTKQTGVNIYVLDGQPFYAFVKAFNDSKKTILLNINSSYVDGGSYSLDGSDKLDTFRDPREYYNIAYGDFNIDQIVHMYPVDSFSKYIRNKSDKATKRINKLYTPDTFVNKSFQYNEIIYSQKNDHSTDELNNRLDKPKPLAIYCYDEITANDISSAKLLKLDIILVKTKNYNIDRNENRLNMFETMNTQNNLTSEVNYLEYYDQDAMQERRK